MDDREVKGVFGALFVAAAFAIVVFAGVVVFSPERTAGRAHTPVPLTAEFESLGETGSSPKPEAGEEGPDAEPSPGAGATSTNRNERAKGMFKWDR